LELVLFDLDNTLLAGDSDYEWGRFLIEKGIVDGPAYEARNDEFFRQYKAGTLNILEFLAFQLAPLAAHPRDQLDRWHEEFMNLKIRPMIGTPARKLVAQHLDKGSLCAIVTATNSFVTAPIAREFGIQHLIATEPEQRDGRFTGRPFGTPCFQQGKVKRMEEWLMSQSLRWQDFVATWFYSDSRNDLPLLKRVSKPVAVDPDDVLRQQAVERGWPVISLR
jgi:HAD superfamily hydrolase (TIGR01490 family)